MDTLLHAEQVGDDKGCDAGASPIPPTQPAITVADGYVVVSTWHYKDKQGQYVYDHHTTMNDALDGYREYEDGEWAHARAIGIFATKNGLPIGGRIEPAKLMQLMEETRAP